MKIKKKMKIAYLFNSSVPSYNASSLQVINVCHQIANCVGKITLITPNTGLKKSLYDHYGIYKNFKILKIKYFDKFPKGINYYFFSISSIIHALCIKPDLFITRNYFTLFLLILLRKKLFLKFILTLK